MEAIRLDEVCKSFGDVRAVSGISARIPTGSITGFLGPNGAGKTTTLRMIMNIIRPDSGTMEILGDRAVERAKARIGYMPEERGLYRKMTVSKVLRYFGTIKGVPSRDLALRVPGWLERLDLAGWANKRTEELSKGMQQKLQFAVTVINEPQLLILDEPFSGLDPLNMDLIKSIILEIRRQGRTVLFSTHAMHDAEALCDSVLLINRGKIILDSSLAALQARHRSHTVVVEMEGDTDFVGALPMVKAAQAEGHRWEIRLAEDADSQPLLQALVGRVRIQRFEVKVPSLHEIFVDLVRSSNAEDPPSRPA
jgi:ABC-2 type transport system ATP-binding protein